MDQLALNENQLYELYDFILQKEQEAEAASLKVTPEGYDNAREKEQLGLLKKLVRCAIHEYIETETLAGRTPNINAKRFEED